MRSTQKLAWKLYKWAYLKKRPQAFPQDAYDNRHTGPIADELSSRGGDLSMPARADEGSIYALYNFRFIAMPWEYFYQAVPKEVKNQNDLTEFQIKLVNNQEFTLSYIDQKSPEMILSHVTE